MGDSESDHYLMLSGIQHFRFCKRQWGLIHVEQQWTENVRTIEGRHIHRNADKPFMREKRGDRIIVRALPVRSDSLRIFGVCDVVEFVQDGNGVEISGSEGKYLAYPVEYKRGKPKKTDEDLLQLAAQAMCLEEMLLCDVDIGYLYYNEIKHRVEVPLTTQVKHRVKSIVDEMQNYYERRHTPKVKPGSFCRNCSLQDTCVPELVGRRSVKSYVEGKIKE